MKRVSIFSLLSFALVSIFAGNALAAILNEGEYPQPNITLYATPASITAGESTTLTWTSRYALSCTASGGWSGSKSRNGTKVVKPTLTTAYFLTCQGRGGSTTVSLEVAVTAITQPPPPPPPSPQCSDGIDNDADGKIDYPDDTGCISATDTDETNVTIPTPLPTCVVSASTSTVQINQPFTVSWTSTNADYVTDTGGKNLASGSITTSVGVTGPYEYAITAYGSGGSARCSTTVQITQETTPPPPPSDKINYSWDPLIKKQCFSIYGTSPQGPDCASNGYRWLWGTTNEDSNFAGGALNSFPIDHPIFKYSFHSRATDGSYEVGTVIDKVNFNYFRDRYSFVGFTDNWDVNPILKPPLSENVHSTFALKMPATDQLDDGINGLAKNRVLIATVATWNGRAHYLEVTLWKTPNFDLCTGACDPNGIYDRKFSYAAGEGIYYDAGKIGMVTGKSLPTLGVSQTYQSYDIPWAQLFRAAPWSDTPASWSGITLQGVYIGVEVWGKGRVWTELNDYQTFADLTQPIPPPIPLPPVCPGFSVPSCGVGTYPTPGSVDAKGCIGASQCTSATLTSTPQPLAVPTANMYPVGGEYGGTGFSGTSAAVVYAPASMTYGSLGTDNRKVWWLSGKVGLSPLKAVVATTTPTPPPDGGGTKTDIGAIQGASYGGSVRVTITASANKLDATDVGSEVLYATTLSPTSGVQSFKVPLGVWGMRPNLAFTVSVQKTVTDSLTYGAVLDGLGLSSFGSRPDQGIVNNDPEWKSTDQQNKQLAALAQFPVTWIHDSIRTTGASWGQAPLLKRVQDQGKKIQLVVGPVDEDYALGVGARVPLSSTFSSWGYGLPFSKLNLDLYEKRLRNNLTSYKNAGVDVKAVEVGNELDLAGFNADIPTTRAPTSADYQLFAESYAKFLERTVSVVKRPEFYPSAKIILGSPALDWSPAFGKLEPGKMYAPLKNLNGKNYFALVDGIGIHYYPADSEDGSASVARTKTFLAAIGEPNRPLWVSEWGFYNNRFPNAAGKDRYRAFVDLYDKILRADYKVVFMTNFALDEFSYPFHLVDASYNKLPEARFFDHYPSPVPSIVSLQKSEPLNVVACVGCTSIDWFDELIAGIRDYFLTLFNT